MCGQILAAMARGQGPDAAAAAAGAAAAAAAGGVGGGEEEAEEVMEGLSEMAKRLLGDQVASPSTAPKRASYHARFRALLGEHAHYLKTCGQPEWATMVVKEFWSCGPKLTSMQYQRLSPEAKHGYDEQRRLYLSRASLVRRAQKQFETGKFSPRLPASFEAMQMPPPWMSGFPAAMPLDPFPRFLPFFPMPFGMEAPPDLLSLMPNLLGGMGAMGGMGGLGPLSLLPPFPFPMDFSLMPPLIPDPAFPLPAIESPDLSSLKVEPASDLPLPTALPLSALPSPGAPLDLTHSSIDES